MPAIHPGWATDAVTSPRIRTAVVLGEGTVCVGRPATVNVLPFGVVSTTVPDPAW
jgi:hypothetical protein